ncbi:unnamed protein product [Aphis gossypii]|uniref:Uncharacterized protein n=1 Tax=Aphis gossypii TaxID=80765 RepID=A0A9P0IL42_APHGO|nr:unnamed protein product [Aphis gossypii]
MTVLQLYTKYVIHVEISISPITFRDIHISPSIINSEIPSTLRAADIRNSFEFSMTVLFPWRDTDTSTSLFIGEITKRHLPTVPLRHENLTQLANALRTSAFLNALQLPMTVTFLRRNTDIVSTYFFGGSGSTQIRVIGWESSILGEIEPPTLPTEEINERVTEFSDSLSVYEPTDEALKSQESSCRSTLEVIVSDDSDEIETMAEIKAAEKPEERKSNQRKSLLKRLGRRLLKVGRRLCCCC